MTWKGRGNNKVQCDRTGAIVHASDCRMTWDGLFVQKRFWYARQPQDIPPPPIPTALPAISRPVGQPEFLPSPQNQPIEWANGAPVTWADGTQVEWSENVVAETDL